MTRLGLLAVVCALVAGCSGSARPKATLHANIRDTMTQRERDSVLGRSGLPGAAVVTKALKAADAEQRHNALIDSLSH